MGPAGAARPGRLHHVVGLGVRIRRGGGGRLGDVFDYSVGPNQAALSAILRYAHEQGFTSRLLESTDLFVPTTLTDAKV